MVFHTVMNHGDIFSRHCKIFGACYNRCNKNFLEAIDMKWVCNICGYEYDEEQGDIDNGIEPGTKFEDLPEDFVCPLCGVGKDDFSEAE